MASRSLHIKCATWDQVESFYQRKLRRGNVLSMKVPFAADAGSTITLGLELPNQLLIAIDGTILKSSQVDGSERRWLEIELNGLTAEVLGRMRNLVAEGRTSAPVRPRPIGGDAAAEELPADERKLFIKMTAELRRLRQLPVHEVLGVSENADPGAVRRGWLELVARYHPDVVAPHRSAAITHLAEEILILLNRAYDRMRASLVAEGRATALGSAMVAHHGWLIGFDELSTGDGLTIDRRVTTTSGRFSAVQVAIVDESQSVHGGAVGGASGDATVGGDQYESQARALLATGDNPAAKEVLATALCVYPRSRPLRSLYYVASALTALDAGHVMMATSQLEAALAHDEQCVEAAAILDALRQDGAQNRNHVQKLFEAR
jgi:hypothetical protein